MRLRFSLTEAAAFLAMAIATPLLFAQPAFAQWKWHGPEPVVGAGSTQPPGATASGPHGIDVVYTGPNGHLYWQWATAPGVYTTPVDLNNVGATSGPSLVANARNRLDALYRGKNQRLWTSWWDGKWWSAPTDLGGVRLKSAPTAVRGGPHKLDVFYVDQSDRLRLSYWNGGPYWSAPAIFASTKVKGPVAVVTTGPHKVEVFYRSLDDHLWHFWSDGGPWSAPTNRGTVITSNPSGASLLNPARTYASVYYRNNSNILCVLQSHKRAAWVNECSGIQVGAMLTAVTVDEVFAMQNNATLRIWRN